MRKASIFAISMVSTVGIFFIGGLAMMALSKGIDGMVLAGAFATIGAIVGRVGMYLRDRLRFRKQ